ncbi:hypothetical protein Bca101_097032 [Brassica carinata]
MARGGARRGGARRGRGRGAHPREETVEMTAESTHNGGQAPIQGVDPAVITAAVVEGLRHWLVLKDGCYKLPHVFSSRDHRSKIVAVLHHGISGPSRLFPAVLNLILNSLLAELYRRGHLQIVKLVSSNGDFSHIYTAGLAPWPCSAPPSKKKLRSSPMVKF